MARKRASSESSSPRTSSGQTSSRTKRRIQSSWSWKSGSVEKSHAIVRSPGRCPARESTARPRAAGPAGPPGEAGHPLDRRIRSGYGAASSGPPHRHRRLLPRPGGARLAHARRRAGHLRGAGAGRRGLPRPHPLAPAPGPALPPEAGLPADRAGDAAVGRRPQLQPRVPHPPLGAARAGLRGAAPAADRADLLPAPGPLQAAVGDVARGGPGGQSLRPDLQDPPLRGRRRFGHRPGHRAVRPDPRATAGRVTEALEGVGEIAWATLNAAPETPVNVEIGPHRRFQGVRFQLEDFKTVKNAFDCTVNDVVLSIVAGALRRFLHHRGTRTEGLELRALVPVSIRPTGAEAQLGNQIAAMRGPLPVYIDDPVARLRAVKQAMDGLKESKQAVGAEVIAAAQNFAPPTVMAQASRLNFSTRLFNLIVTNVPGPQFPLYILGREMQEIFPVAFLPENHAMALAIMSYNGGLNVGLLADFDAVPDLDVVAEGLRESLDELLDAAAKAAGRSGRKRAGSPSGGRGKGPRSRSRNGSRAT